ncbi:MAG: hypothetical protein KDB63_06550 [Nocardioidaceae bacterium]|nr:hypothetical protein [Nocardioidaceae bacterium]
MRRVQRAAGDGVLELVEGVVAVGCEQDQVCAQGRPGGGVAQPGVEHLRGGVEAVEVRLAEVTFGRQVQRVAVLADRLPEQNCGVGVVGRGGGGRAGRPVAGKNRLQDVDGGARVRRLGADEGVSVGVADDVEMEVVAVPAPRGRRVEQLPRLAPGQQGVAAGSGHPLGGVDSRGVPEGQVRGDILARQRHAARVVDSSDGDGAATGQGGDRPPVAVLDEVAGA